MHETNISAWQALMDAVGGWVSQGQTHIRNKQMEGGGPPPPPPGPNPLVPPADPPPTSPSSNAGGSLSRGTGKGFRLTWMVNFAIQWWCFCEDFFLDMNKLQMLCCTCVTTEAGNSVVVVLGISSKSPWFNLMYTQYPVYMSVVLCKYGILSTISQLQQ